MCGRLFIKPVTSLEKVLEMLKILKTNLPLLNNVAPTEAVPLIHQQIEGLTVSPARWWLHPHWSKEEPNQKFAMFNARIETVLTSPAFKGPMQYRRGIIPAAAFVEWHTNGKQKQPYYIEAIDAPLLIAAIWDVWQDQLLSCAIITQPADASFDKIHNRMPLSLTIDQAKFWLDHQNEPKHILEVLYGQSLPYRFRSISTKVNNARNKDDVEFIEVSNN